MKESHLQNLENIIKHLSKFITEERLNLFNNILQDRTRYITVALENIYQPQNASAVLRTSECFGIQDVHIIENDNSYNVNPDVVMGSTKWINVFRYNQLENNTLNTINKLKNNGYRIVATTPHKGDVNLADFDLSDGKVALFFGTELKGLSDTVLENADEFLKIPMCGFTESLNISVSASVIIHQLTNKLRDVDINWQLSDIEKKKIIFRWMANTIKKSELIIDDFISTNKIDFDEFNNI